MVNKLCCQFQIRALEKDTGRRDTIFDKVFKGALNDFHTNLITQLGLALQVRGMNSGLDITTLSVLTCVHNGIKIRW